MFGIKIRIKTIIFAFAIAVLVTAGIIWHWETNNGPLTDVEQEEWLNYVDRGLPEDARALLEQKTSDLEAAMANDSLVAGDISQWLILGNLKYQLGDLAGAKAAYEQILVDHPQDAPALENLGQALFEMGDYAGAEAKWRAALSANPWEVTYLKLVDLIYTKIPARSSEIQTILEEAIATLGQTPGLLSRLGDWYLENGEYQRAISHYQVAKQLGGSVETLDEKIAEAREKWSN